MANLYHSLNSYYKEVGKHPLLTRTEERELSEQKHEGGKKAKQAIHKLVESNLRLVVKIAQDFQGRGLDLEDLISEGNLGLCTAAKKFDFKKGAKFSYYSSFWIKQNILRAVANHGRLIRIPVCTLDKYFKMASFIKAYEEKHNEKPSNKKIAKKFKITPKRVAEILDSVGTVMPLDAKIGSEGNTKIHDVIADDIERSPDESTQQIETNKILHELVDKLPKREVFIIKSRFNLNGEGKKTLESIGQKLKITRERVRQIESVALNKLRAMAKDKLCA